MNGHQRVLAVASGGGHWVQLLRLRPAFAHHAVTYVTTTDAHRATLAADAGDTGNPAPGYFVIPEGNRWQKGRLIRQLVMLAAIVLRVRPHVVITTGAAPGYFAIRLAKFIGARTVWIDSIANAEELSLAGRKVGRHADLWLTQWEDLARPEGPRYMGAVL